MPHRHQNRSPLIERVPGCVDAGKSRFDDHTPRRVERVGAEIERRALKRRLKHTWNVIREQRIPEAKPEQRTYTAAFVVHALPTPAAIELFRTKMATVVGNIVIGSGKSRIVLKCELLHSDEALSFSSVRIGMIGLIFIFVTACLTLSRQPPLIIQYVVLMACPGSKLLLPGGIVVIRSEEQSFLPDPPGLRIHGSAADNFRRDGRIRREFEQNYTSRFRLSRMLSHC